MEFALLFLIAFIAFYLILLGFSKDEEKINLAERIGREESANKNKKTSMLSVFAPLNDKLLNKMGAKSYYSQQMYFLGSGYNWKAGEFFALKELAVFAFIIVFLGFSLKGIWLLVIGLIVAFFLPDVWLRLQVSKRKEAIRRWLPETVDLLYLCVSAGLDFLSSLKWILRKSRTNPMLEELKTVLDEVNIGKSRVQALKDMSKRLSIPDVSSFVQGIIQAERMGTPVAEAFNIISEDSRYRRLQRGERQAMKAPLKILIPLIFFILPAVMIIVGGPILIRFLKGDFNITI